MYFLSSTFRHFYKRYLFFWAHKPCCCRCSLKRYHVNSTQRRRTGENVTVTEYTRRSSANNVTTIYYDLNRIKNSNNYQQQTQSPIRMHRCTHSDRTSTEIGTHTNGTAGQSPVNTN